MDAPLVGRSAVLAEVNALARAGRSVLLVGPAGSGKTAVIERVRRDGMLVVDPFEHISTPHAASLRRALDRGAVILAGARSLDRADMGHVGRVAWRLEPVWLRPLPARAILAILRARLPEATGPALQPGRQWFSDAVRAADGLPGRAVSIASMAVRRWRECGVIMAPRLALIAAWQATCEQRPGSPGRTSLRLEE